VELIIDRDVRVVPSVGKRTAERLNEMEIYTVRDLYDREVEVMEHFGSQGAVLMDLSKGLDDRKVTPYRPEDAKSISREITFQEDVYDYEFLKDVLFLLALSVESRAGRYNLHGNGVVLKITYSDMKSITRSRVTKSCDDAMTIHREAVEMLSALKKRPVRLIGAGVYNLTEQRLRQVTLDELFDTGAGGPDDRKEMFDRLQKRYHIDFSKRMEQMDRSDSLHRLVEDMRIQRLMPSVDSSNI
jgi:DNA polymerase-4/DNA polymerase IV (DinB-like DNA polymerase)